MMFACERCYSRKTKCDRRLPQCTSCAKSRAVCQYANKRRDRQLQQEYTRSIEARLRELERENEQLRGQLYAQSQKTEQTASPSSRQSPNDPDDVRKMEVEDYKSPAKSVTPLPRSPCEEPRYLGSSNGVDFVDVVERVVDSKHTGGLYWRIVDSRGTRNKVALPSVPQPPALVDEATAMPLIKSYFEHWHVTFPLLYRPAFMQMVQRMYADPDVYRQEAACAFAFDIVLALGSVPSNRVEWCFSDAELHFARALTRLQEVSTKRDIRSLQALLLYCKYGIHASMRDTSREMWEVLGKATQLCIELGMHNNTDKVLPKCETHITGPLPASMLVEMQRRCFWCYYNLERSVQHFSRCSPDKGLTMSRIVNISLGRPLCLQDDDISVPLPSTHDDDALNQENIPPPVTSPFLQHIRLRQIQSKIHRMMYTSRSVQGLPLRDRQAIRREIFGELEMWKKETSLLSLPPTEQAPSVSTVFLHPNWYQAVYHSACLMLFRPSTAFPAMEGYESDGEVDNCLEILWNSSRQVVANYFELLRVRHLNYSWVCLYSIMMAGLANVYSVGCCAQRRKRGVEGFLPSYFDVVSDVRDCSNILTAICERWDDARGPCDIFNRLSMSALRELSLVSFSSPPSHPVPKTEEAQFSEAKSQQPLHQEPHLQGDRPPTLGLMATPAGYGEYASDAWFSDYDPNANFQQLFRDMQDSINSSGYM